MIRSAFIVASSCMAVVVGTAAAVLLTGTSGDARAFLRFGFDGPDASSLDLAAHNARLSAVALLGAIAVPRLRRARVAVDLTLATVLVVNAVAIGAALGAYGGRAAVALAPHAPIELAALSFAGGAFMDAHRTPVPVMSLIAIGAVSLALLLVAAVLETSVRLGGHQ